MYVSDLRLLTDDKTDFGKCVNRRPKATSREKEKIKQRSLEDGDEMRRIHEPGALPRHLCLLWYAFPDCAIISLDGVILRLSASSHDVVLPE